MTTVTRIKAVTKDALPDPAGEQMERDMATILVELKGRDHPAKADIALLTERHKVRSADIASEKKELEMLREELALLLDNISEKEKHIDQMASVDEVLMQAAVTLTALSKSANGKGAKK